MRRRIRFILIGMLIIICVIFSQVLINHLLNKYSVLPKQKRMQNLIAFSGTDRLNDSNYGREIQAALSKYTNWDNLFLSESFKKKYKNRESILDDVNDIAHISSGIGYKYGKDTVVIFAEKKTGIFDKDDSDDITTEYHFRYILDEAGDIDDLILLEKQDIYTINGEPAGS